MLDADHAGLEDVKDRIVEYVAVRKLREERGIEASDNASASGAILTLIGPPGTGKTSIGESIARAMGREFVRMSLGGVRDEAEIRGHRRTYIGALPGRLVRALRDAGTMNPVILLDEVDKVGADWRGDPSAALLEVLDPAQNSTFRDHYLDVELDLSRGRVHRHRQPGRDHPRPAAGPHGGHPLRRLHRGREGRRSPATTCGRASASATGCARTRSPSPTTSCELVVREYTREAGVRQLERELGTLLRKTATRIASATAQAPGRRSTSSSSATRSAARRCSRRRRSRTAVPGVATGLAVTGVGGDVLFVEANAMDGKGGLTLTGQLGDVMKESARIALTLRARRTRDELGIDPHGFEDTRVPRPRPGGRDPEGRPERGRHDDDGARVAADRPPGASTRSA